MVTGSVMDVVRTNVSFMNFVVFPNRADVFYDLSYDPHDNDQVAALQRLQHARFVRAVGTHTVPPTDPEKRKSFFQSHSVSLTLASCTATKTAAPSLG